MARSKARSGVKSGSDRAAKKKVVRWNGAPGLKGQRRETILRSVGNVLRNSGLSSLTIQDIADELGMTKGNLYYYFKDKQDILYQCHMRCMDISLHALKQATAADGSADEKLRILLVGHIHGVLDDGFGSILQTDLESFWPDQRKQYVGKRDQLERGVRKLIEDGVRSGEFECDNVKLAGFSILGAINWIPKWYRPNGPLHADEIADSMVEYFLRGLRCGIARRASERRPRRNGKDSVQRMLATQES
jgi:AcrR family transcriptional regulator